MSTAPRSPRAKRDWGTDDSGTPILHVDMDSFFAAVEIAEDPTLAGKPLIVGGRSHRGVVTSSTYDVRALGVRAGMPIHQARSLAPMALILPGNHDLYRDYSKEVMRILSAITPLMEPLSIDEAFLDVSGSRRRLGAPRGIAQQLRTELRNKLRLPASVGIGNSKTVAKIASSHAKPDGILLVPAAMTVPFLHSLPVGALPGVGGRTSAALARRGIDTVEQLAATDLPTLIRWLGEAQARHLNRIANGEDRRPVGNSQPEKSVSTERTFSVNVTSRRELETYLLEASHDCGRRLRAEGLVTWTVQIKLRDAKFRTITRAQTLAAPTDLGRDIARVALLLWKKEKLPPGGIRLAGVGAQSLAPRDGGVQVTLEDEGERPRAAETAMDAVVKKYGAAAITPATLLENSASRNPLPNRRSDKNRIE